MERPNKNEYYPGYQPYIDLVGKGDFIQLLDQNTDSTISLFRSINKNQEHLKYAPNKWTIKEVLMHIIDTERGFSYRAMVCARNDGKIPLYPLDHEYYAKNIDVTNINMNDLIEEFIAVRQGFKFIYTNNHNSNFDFLGDGVNYKISARALGYIAIGHVAHHCSIIKEKYLR